VDKDRSDLHLKALMDHSKRRQMIKENYSNSISDRFPSVLLTLLVGRQEEHRACKKPGCGWWRFDWYFAHLKAPVVTTHHLHHP